MKEIIIQEEVEEKNATMESQARERDVDEQPDK